jgi:hypothetical protein
MFNSRNGPQIKFEIKFYVESGLFLQEPGNYITFMFTIIVCVFFINFLNRFADFMKPHMNIMFLRASWLPCVLILFNNQVVVQTL